MDSTHAVLIFPALALVCALYLVCVIIFVGIYAYRLNKRYQRRMLEEFDDDDVYFTHRGHPFRYQDAMKTELQYTGYSKIDPETANLISKSSIPSANNNEGKLIDPNSKNRKSSEKEVCI